MAGMSQTCNHVAAALFRVEAASTLGRNNLSFTSITSVNGYQITKLQSQFKLRNYTFAEMNLAQDVE